MSCGPYIQEQVALEFHWIHLGESGYRRHMRERVSIRDIANQLGVHHTTVSLALRDSPLLKRATKEKIQTLAQELGYRPDPMLSALSAYRQSKRPAAFHGVLGWIHSWPSLKQQLEVPTYRDYFEGARNHAERLGYSLREFWVIEPGMTPAKLQRILRARNVQGLLISPQPVSRTDLGLNFDEVCAVAFGYSMQPAILHLVTSRHDQVIDLLLENIYRLGYRRPGFCVAMPSDSGNNNLWAAKWAHFLSEHPEVTPIPRLSDDGTKSLSKWLRQYKPDVLVGFSHLLPIIESMGYRVPEDIGLASLAVDRRDPRISGIDQNDTIIGRAAIDVLVGIMHRGQKGPPDVPIRTLVDGNWFEGETLRQQEPRRRNRAR